MWLYRDRSSPFYSSVGVTENERPVLAREVAAIFERAGFACRRTISPVSPIAMSRRARARLCCRSTISSMPRSSGYPCMEPAASFRADRGRTSLDDAAPSSTSSFRSTTRAATSCRPGGAGKRVTTPARVLICYDHADDDTLPAVRAKSARRSRSSSSAIAGRGAHGAVMAGFLRARSPFVMMYPADDDINAAMLDAMVALAREGCDIVCASRFMPGGAMVGCPLA